MPVTERSLANLKPAWTKETAPRNGGAWPEWRTALREVVGNGAELFQTLGRLARGQAVPALGPDGTPLVEAETGQAVLLVPSLPIVLAAAREVLDRAYGKPVQTVVEIPSVAPTGRDASPALTEEERNSILKIAHGAMLRAGQAATQPK